MQHISTDDLRQAINQFLQTKFKKDFRKELDELDKARQKNDAKKITKLEEKLDKAKNEYLSTHLENHIGVNSLKPPYLGTHISKGIHPSSKGDNVISKKLPLLPDTLVGFQNINSTLIDLSGNAAALAAGTFLNWPVTETLRIQDIILEQPSIIKPFLPNIEIFQEALLYKPKRPKTDGRNKQILWPIDNTISDSYYCLIPLHPSVLTYHFKNKINQLRWRKKENIEPHEYITINDLAKITYSSDQSRNIGHLSNSQRGEYYLLPSLPPTFSSDGYPSINSNSTSLFNKPLYRHCALLFQALSEIIQDDRNTIHIREYREVIVKKIITRVLNVALYHRNNRPAGWSRQCDRLDEMQVFWLDPGRSALTDEQDFTLEDRCKEDWQTPIKNDFADWAIARLKMLSKEQKTTFADAEIRYWRTTFIDTTGELSRDNQEIWT